MADKEKTYIEFTEEMRKDYTILIPNMLPTHFKLVSKVLTNYGYKSKLLETTGTQVRETGLRYVHNDTCYPAILIIGQFIDALQSGEFDPHKVALILFQTGGGCRASNYISLLRKALIRAGYGYVPVISLSFTGIEKHSGFKLKLGMVKRLMYAILYADLLMSLVNQTKPYEINPGDTDKKNEYWSSKLTEEMNNMKISYKVVNNNYEKLIKDFASIPLKKEEKVKVGIVGEIFVKFSPLGNNGLADFLLNEGAEVVVPGLLDFFMYCVFNNIIDSDLYGRGKHKQFIIKKAYRYLLDKQKDMIEAVKKDGTFRPATPFSHTVSLTEGYINHGVKMGEGWLLTAEMLELSESGIKNIVCTQPFGCLPNHICGKGMMKPLKMKNPGLNIIAIDYDTGASIVNQQNRIKLMLAGAQRNTEESIG